MARLSKLKFFTSIFILQYYYFNIIFQISMGIKHSDPNFQAPVAKEEPVEYLYPFMSTSFPHRIF